MKFAWFFVILATSANAADWWQNANFYQIYPRSFKDSDGDGIGDIRGILQKLDHLQELGVTATWLSPVLKSPQADFGYDIEDFKVVDELFGKNEDLFELFEEAHKRGIKVIMDFVPNHTSDEHEWFKKSVAKEPGYEDYYVWHDGRMNGTKLDYPNNWQAVFSTRAWTWHPDRKQYYLHQFDKKQPDLNYRNPAVVQEMKDVLTFWMDMGADGFRIDAINHMFEVADFRDEPLTGWTDDDTSYGFTHHIYTKDLPETYEMVGQWKELIAKYNAEHEGSTRVMFTEAYAELDDTLRYYEVANFPFNFALIEKLNENSNAYEFKNQIDVWLTSMPQGAAANWVLGNHDKPRFGSRYGTERIDGMMTLLLCLPGVAITYNGDEIGMLDHRDISWEDTLDPQGCNAGRDNFKWSSRDPQRTPFQWDNTTNAGFSTATKTWVPMHPNYMTLNLAEQKAAPKSFYKTYQELASLRNHEAFVDGDFRTHAYDEKVFAFRRSFNGQVFYGLINFGAAERSVDLMEFADFVPENAVVVVAGSKSSFDADDEVNERAVVLKAYDAIILMADATKATDPPTVSTPTGTDSTTAGTSTTTTSTTTTDAGCSLFASFVLLVASLVMIHFI